MNRAILSAVLGLKICLYGQSLAQSQVPDVNSRLLRIASERERILQYAVQCKIEGPLGNLSSFEPKWVSDNNTKVDLYYEYSRIEQHYITAIRNLETPVRRWVLLGTSRDKKLVGRTGGEMQVIRLDSVAERAYSQADARHTKLKSFDPMAIGLVFCGDFYNGLSFEAQLGDLLNNRKDFSKLVEEGDSVTWSTPDTVMTFDRKRGYWPTKLDYNNGEITWEIEIGKHKEFYVPTRAVLTCNPPRVATKARAASKAVTTIFFEWITINEEFSVGDQAIERLARKFDISYAN